jgi:hypothetical protein
MALKIDPPEARIACVGHVYNELGRNEQFL